jgi:excisionase family DNA binding protein
MQTAKQLLSLAECAKALGVSERTIRRLVTARRVPAYKVGGQWRLDLDEVKACLRSAVSTPSVGGDDAPPPPLIV